MGEATQGVSIEITEIGVGNNEFVAIFGERIVLIEL
jgi:hypothetical protein